MDLFLAILSGGGVTITLFVVFLALDRSIDGWAPLHWQRRLHDLLVMLLAVGACAFHKDGPGGLLLDLHGAALGLAVLFRGARFGLLVAVVEMLAHVAFKESALTLGIANIAFTLLCALAGKRWLVPIVKISFLSSVGLGVIVGLANASALLFLPPFFVGWEPLLTYGPSVLAVQLTTMLLFGWLFSLQLDRKVGQQARAVLELETLALSHGLASTRVEFILKINLDGTILEASSAYARRSGFSLTQLKQMRLQDLRAVSAIIGMDNLLDRIKQEGHLIYETEHRDTKGSAWPVEVNAVYDAEGDYIIAFMRDITERRRAEQATAEHTRALQRALEQTIDVLSSTLNFRDPMARGHSRHVRELALRIGQSMGLGPERLQGLWLAATVQNIGQIQTPADILNRPRQLTPEEFELVKTHPEAGYAILHEIALPWPVADIVRQHHENMDGSGYPFGLKGEAIGLEARILRVADSLIAMCSHRPFRRAHDHEYALAELRRHAGDLYDPDVVETCLEIIRTEGFPDLHATRRYS